MYNPGITDQRGQLLAQGINQFGSELEQGIHNFQQNQVMTAQSVAKFKAAVAQNPEMEKVLSGPLAPDDAGGAYQKLIGGGKLGVKDAAFLNQFTDTYLNTKSQVQKQQQEAAQTALLNFQLSKAQKDEQDRQAAEARLQNIARFQTNPGAGTGPLNNAAYSALQQQAQNPLVQAAITHQAVTGQAPTGPEAVNLGDTLEKTGARLAALKAPRAVNPVVIGGTDANGNPVKNYVDAVTGQKLGTEPVQQIKNVLSPDEQISVDKAKASGEADAKNASAYVDTVTKEAEDAQHLGAQIARARQLYAQGATSGFGQDFVTQAGAFAYRAGLGDAKQQADREELQKILVGSALNTIKEMTPTGGGRITDTLRNLVSQASAEAVKTPAANLRIFDAADALIQHKTDKELERQRLVDSGLNTMQVAEQLKRWNLKNPIAGYVDRSIHSDPSNLVDQSSQKPASAPPANVAAPNISPTPAPSAPNIDELLLKYQKK